MNVERRNKRGNATLNVQLHYRESDPFLSILLSRALSVPLAVAFRFSVSYQGDRAGSLQSPIRSPRLTRDPSRLLSYSRD